MDEFFFLAKLTPSRPIATSRARIHAKIFLSGLMLQQHSVNSNVRFFRVGVKTLVVSRSFFT